MYRECLDCCILTLFGSTYSSWSIRSPTIKLKGVELHVKMMHAPFKFRNVVLNCNLCPLNPFYLLLDLSCRIFKIFDL
ncbi:hypothetical protein ZEAMMB73_Zm00001d041311 [Zea mays]|uniref:Uncharacterized protein n=1 Tax=Zea mays TaxID=4577 RepID=A0A1D6MVG3_MAIZE|nr:hypothetical protein ZEAMMB73_Zm00001d041311 [Zea mays]